MEDGLRDSVEFPQEPKYTVLILVLVEDGLRAFFFFTFNPLATSLNPCSCGGWSQRYLIFLKLFLIIKVLILVLVEDGLRAQSLMPESLVNTLS